MEVYKSIYDIMLSKAISYGYAEEQVLDILSASHDRTELVTYVNIPDGEKYWMAERWTWEILYELSTFPGEKPKWKGVEKSTYMSPLVGETANNLQADTVDIPSSTPKASNACRSLPGLQDFRRHVAETYIQRPSSVQAPKMPSMDIPRKY
ncbi:hypothetical protein EYC84_004305 [Monilinia fructicola]|uniref:Uncharacterized protein n=1 Tax=Monilinia fructicola TaxID=38448 RepID=A0A5M9K4Y8_MONFR|nr:hypothetical protein EYC84_004305 [Monilinia fructicola]